jgi:hypothetical protein
MIILKTYKIVMSTNTNPMMFGFSSDVEVEQGSAGSMRNCSLITCNAGYLEIGI